MNLNRIPVHIRISDWAISVFKKLAIKRRKRFFSELIRDVVEEYAIKHEKDVI